MSNEVHVEDFVEREFGDDSGELNTKEDVSICLGSEKRMSKNIGIPQKFGTILIPFLVLVKMTTSYWQNASYVILHAWLQVHMEL
jgi:hypothetical protein